MAMLLAPDSGTVTVDGDRVDAFGVRAPRELRHSVQLVWQSPPAVDPRLRLGDAILEPLAASRMLPPDPPGLLESWARRAGLTHWRRPRIAGRSGVAWQRRAWLQLIATRSAAGRVEVIVLG